MPPLSSELQYMLVLLGLFVVPRALQRARIPSAITCVALGAALGMGAHLFAQDRVIPLLSTFGIVSLFLFAGLEVDFNELRKGARVVSEHLAVQLVLLAATSFAALRLFGIEARAAVLLALALLTPSTGFILDSLEGFGLSADHRFWVKSKAIATEIVALTALFVTVKSSNGASLALSSAALLAMVAALPVAFQLFARWVLPYAPRSEFSFLVIVAVFCALLTRRLGVYYLVGAFVVGVTAVRLRARLPMLASERLVVGIELFATFFIPFYFFKAGLHLHAGDFTPVSVGIGLAFLAVMTPLRLLSVVLHRGISLREPSKQSYRVGMSLVPTLVFNIVLADILKERFALASHLYGALIVYALGTTLLPGFALRVPAPEFDTPEVPPAQGHRGASE